MGEYQFNSLEYILSSCFGQAHNLQVNIFDGLEVCDSFYHFLYLKMEIELIIQYIMHIFIHAMGKVQRKYAHGNIKSLSQSFRNGLYFVSL